MDELITRIKADIRKEKTRHEPLNERSWQYEYGVLLTVTEAEQIVEMYERKQKETKPQSNCNLPAVSKSESIEREALAKLSKWAVSQKDCPSEFQDIVNKEFWNLI